MELQFQGRPALEIRGRRYEADLSDVGFLEAVVTDFSAILWEYEELVRAREKLSADRAAALSAEGCRNTSRQLARCGERLVELSRGFIEKTLGRRPTPLRSAGEGQTVPSISGSAPISMRRRPRAPAGSARGVCN